jgi:hypothetical protein
VTEPWPLSDDEFKRFRHLLVRFCAWDLDQWEAWRTDTAHGRVFITISRTPEDGADPDAGYDPIDQPGRTRGG